MSIHLGLAFPFRPHHANFQAGQVQNGSAIFFIPVIFQQMSLNYYYQKSFNDLVQALIVRTRFHCIYLHLKMNAAHEKDNPATKMTKGKSKCSKVMAFNGSGGSL